MTTLPNVLTVFRLCLVPVFVLLMIEPSESEQIAAAMIFALAAITDLLDGYLARQWDTVSDFGKLLDPVADKVLVMSALVMLVAQRSSTDGSSWVPAWLVVLILAREFWITGLRSFAASRGRVVPAGAGGKLKSVLQMFGIFLLLFTDLSFVAVGDNVWLSTYFWGMNLLILSVGISYYSAMEYSYAILRTETPR